MRGKSKNNSECGMRNAEYLTPAGYSAFRIPHSELTNFFKDEVGEA